MMRKQFFSVVIIAIVLCLTIVSAHEDESSALGSWSQPIPYIIATAIWLIVLAAFYLVFKDAGEKHKKAIFWLMVIPIVLSSFYLAGHTIYDNINSVTKGPVHWHADYQVWVCEKELDLIDPRFPSNKIGTPLFHEHNDDRIHVEGTVDDYEDVNVGAYFKVIGGELTPTSLKYNTVDGMVSVKNGDLCGNEAGELKVYVNGKKMDNPQDYMYAHYAYVPPGDCIIVEFGPGLADTTQRICESWRVKGWTYENQESMRNP